MSVKIWDKIWVGACGIWSLGLLCPVEGELVPHSQPSLDFFFFFTFTSLIHRILQASGKNLNLNDESQHGLLMQLLKLTHNCLNFDFIGTSTDESSDDLCTVQIPTSWRSGNLAGGRGLIYSVSAGSWADLIKPSLYLNFCVRCQM